MLRKSIRFLVSDPFVSWGGLTCQCFNTGRLSKHENSYGGQFDKLFLVSFSYWLKKEKNTDAAKSPSFPINRTEPLFLSSKGLEDGVHIELGTIHGSQAGVLSHSQPQGLSHFAFCLPCPLGFDPIFELTCMILSSFELFKCMWQNHTKGKLIDREFIGVVMKNLVYGRITYLHSVKGAEMAPTMGGAHDNNTLLVRKLPDVDTRYVKFGSCK